MEKEGVPGLRWGGPFLEKGLGGEETDNIERMRALPRSHSSQGKTELVLTPQPPQDTSQ